jgi:hypothetical protein
MSRKATAAKTGGASAQIYSDIKNLALDDAYKFPLWTLNLVMQAPQNIA